MKEYELNKALPYLETIQGEFKYLLEDHIDVSNFVKIFHNFTYDMISTYLKAVPRGRVLVADNLYTISGLRLWPSSVPYSSIKTKYRTDIKYNLEEVDEGKLVMSIKELDSLDLSNEIYAKSLDLLNSGETLIIYGKFNNHVLVNSVRKTNFAL